MNKAVKHAEKETFSLYVCDILTKDHEDLGSTFETRVEYVECVSFEIKELVGHIIVLQRCLIIC